MNDIKELLAVLAHEMRTPISAILGYQELLSEGIYGPISDRGKEPLDRIAYSARQLLHLIDGVQEIGSPGAKRLNTQPVQFDPAGVLRKCVQSAHADAVGRNVTIDAPLENSLPSLYGDPDRFCRAIDLALAAAIKTAHRATLTVEAQPSGNGVDVVITGTELQPERDNPDFMAANAGHPSGAGLRLAIAREITRRMHGRLELHDSPQGTTLLLHFEPIEIAVAADSD